MISTTYIHVFWARHLVKWSAAVGLTKEPVNPTPLPTGLTGHLKLADSDSSNLVESFISEWKEHDVTSATEAILLYLKNPATKKFLILLFNW